MYPFSLPYVQAGSFGFPPHLLYQDQLQTGMPWQYPGFLPHPVLDSGPCTGQPPSPPPLPPALTLLPSEYAGADETILDIQSQSFPSHSDADSLQIPSEYSSASSPLQESSYASSSAISFPQIDASELSTEFLDHPLGSGAFGNVYKARWRGADVAVKMLQSQTLSSK